MGWDVDLELDGKDVQVTPHQEGSNITIGGSTEASMDVTYNYSGIYWDKLGVSIADYLKDKKASETISFLKDAIKKIGTTRPTGSYWDATPGNVGHILAVLLDWAEQHPEATWRIWK